MSPRRSPAAFTLIELLVSMTVLALITVSVLAMVNGVSGTTGADRRRMDADNEARRVFDRMAFDFAKMFKRADADALFASLPMAGPGSAGTNDKMFFYSEAPTYFDTLANSGSGGGAPTPDPRGTAGLIGYRVNNSPTSSYRWQLERLGKGLTWDGAQAANSAPGGVVFLTYPPVTNPAASPSPSPTLTPFPMSTLAGNWPQTIGTVDKNYDDGTDVDYHPLSGFVFRMEYCFALRNATAAKPFATTRDQAKGFRDVAAVVVAIALLDPPSRALIPGTAAGQPADLSKIAAALPDPDFTQSPTQLMAELWNSKIKAADFATVTKIPQTVAARVRVYQRYFYLNTPQ